MDLSMDVAPSQMMGLPLIDWCGAGFCAGAAVEAVDGPVGAAAAIPAGAAVAPATLLLEEWAGAAPVAVGNKLEVGAAPVVVGNTLEAEATPALPPPPQTKGPLPHLIQWGA